MKQISKTAILFISVLFYSQIKSVAQNLTLEKTVTLNTFQNKNLQVPDGNIWVVLHESALTSFKSTVSMLSKGGAATYNHLYYGIMSLKQSNKISGGYEIKCPNDILHMEELTVTNYFNEAAIICSGGKIIREGTGNKIFILKYKESGDILDTSNIAAFDIPFNSNEYSEPGTKPPIQDKNLKYISFKCSGALVDYKLKDNIYTLSLTSNKFHMQTSDGTYVFSVKENHYDEEYKKQVFKLTGKDDAHAADLKISYVGGNINRYSILLNFTDGKGKYQFQNIQVLDKIAQRTGKKNSP